MKRNIAAAGIIAFGLIVAAILTTRRPAKRAADGVGDMTGEPQNYLAKRRKEFARLKQRREEEGQEPTYRVRFVFRVGAKFNVAKARFEATVANTPIEIVAQAGTTINKADWLVIHADLDTADAASKFGDRLQTAFALAAANTRLGIDVGHKNRATLDLIEDVKRQFAERGLAFVTDVQGVQIYPNDMAVIESIFPLAVGLLNNPKAIFEAVDQFFGSAIELDDQHLNAVLLLDTALLTHEPLARLVLAISAVELLAQQPGWSQQQKAAIKHLLKSLETMDDMSDTERDELKTAVANVYRFSIAESCRRLLKSLGLEALKDVWAKCYGVRSAIFHGRTPAIDVDLPRVSESALNLCGRIILTAAARQVPGADADIDSKYPQPN